MTTWDSVEQQLPFHCTTLTLQHITLCVFVGIPLLFLLRCFFLLVIVPFVSVSGQVPEEPVVDPRTGQVYEKRLIEKHIETTGKCPLTDEDLKKDDLIVIKSECLFRSVPIRALSTGLLLVEQTTKP